MKRFATRLLRRLRDLLLPGDRDRDIQQELELHFEAIVDEGLQSIAVYDAIRATLTGRGTPEPASQARVTPSVAAGRA